MKLDEPLTFPAAAKAIGWEPDEHGKYRSAGRRLLRLAQKRERELAVRFIVRDKAFRPVKITLGALARHLPECVPSRVDALADQIRPAVEQVSIRAREIVDEALAIKIEPELERLARMNRSLAAQLERVSAMVVTLRAELDSRRPA